MRVWEWYGIDTDCPELRYNGKFRCVKIKCRTFIYRVSEHAQTKNFGLCNKGARKKKVFFLKIEKMLGLF